MIKLLAIFLLSVNSLMAQSMRIELEISRIPVNSPNPPTTTKERVLLIFEDTNIGLITTNDTLALELVKLSNITNVYTTGRQEGIYQDLYHNNQPYWVIKVKGTDGIGIFFIPLKPYNRELYTINLKI